jgi:DNA-binding MarR family transcriptional regulator
MDAEADFLHHPDARAEIEAIPVRESFAFMTRLAYLALRGMLHEDLAVHGLTSGIWYYLWALWEEDGINQKELSSRVRIKEAGTTVTLQTMNALGLIRRERSADDRRNVKIYLTKAGRALERDLLPYAIKANTIALEGFTRDEVVQFHAYMRRIIGNLGPHDPGLTA